MLKHYCPECGNPTNYSLNKPKFCSSCGLNFDTKDNLNSKSSVVLNKIKKNSPSNKEDDFDDDNGLEHYENNIKQLDFDISTNKLVKNTIKDLMGTAEKGEQPRTPRKKMSKLEKKKILQDFSNEARSIKPKNKN